jgi:hypothetical protein
MKPSNTSDLSVSRPTPCLMPFLSRFLLANIAGGAIAMSLFTIYSCEFFSYEALDGKPWVDLTLPFDDLAEASVGLFRYSETIGDDYGLFGESCLEYDDWRDVSQHTYFFAAQWCSLVAPGVASFALIQMILEWCCCRVRGSYFFLRLLFVVSTLLQLCSFLVFLESQYWCVDLVVSIYLFVFFTVLLIFLSVCSANLPFLCRLTNLDTKASTQLHKTNVECEKGPCTRFQPLACICWWRFVLSS